MKDVKPPTLDELHRRRQRALEKAERAIASFPEDYREVKRLLARILDQPLDVADYYRVAGQMVRLLEKLSASSTGSLFAYYCANIDPGRQGDARYFRIVCEDLRRQLHLVDSYRMQRHGIRIIG